MISITCTNCQTRLTIDDAFAGGVCRCQHCGTIQTVPSRAGGIRGGNEGTHTPAQAPRVLFQSRSRGEGSAMAGLNELADVVASSGLASGFANRAERPVKPRTSLLPLIVSGAGIAALLMGVLVYMLLRRAADNRHVGAPPDRGTSIVARPSAGADVVPASPTTQGVSAELND